MFNEFHSINSATKAFTLHEVDSDIGHTLVHYLYSDQYETLKEPGAIGLPVSTTEYRRVIQVYCAAKLYKLDGLVDQAKNKIELFGTDLSLFDLLEITGDAYLHLPEDEIWLSTYLSDRMKMAFEDDESLFTQDEFVDHVGQNVRFNKLLMKAIVSIYANKSQRTEACSSGANAFEEIVADTVAAAPAEDLDGECPLLLSSSLEEHAAPSLDLSVLNGRRVQKFGIVLDDTLQALGQVVEGDPKKMIKRKATCDASGIVWAGSNILGKVRLLAVDRPVKADSFIPAEDAALVQSKRLEHPLRKETGPSTCPAEAQHMSSVEWTCCKTCRDVTLQRSIQILPQTNISADDTKA